MDARNLKYFVQISESRSFSKAANILHIGQPALSRSIQQLEEELGAQLFIRARRGVELTSAGQTLQTKSRIILDQLDQLRDEVRAQAFEVAGTATVGIPPAAGQLIVPDVMRLLNEQHPGIRLHIIEGLSSEIHDRLINRTVQIGLMYDAPAFGELICEPLAVENMFLIGRKDRIAALGRIRDLAQIENLPLILPKAPNSRRLLVEKAFGARGMTLNIAAEVDGFATTHALLEDGIGYSLMTQAAVSGRYRDSSLVAVELKSGGLQWELDLVRHRSQMNNQVLNEVVSRITQVTARLIQDGRWKGVKLIKGASRAITSPTVPAPVSATDSRRASLPSGSGRRRARLPPH